ncbi:MAG: TlpA family protein disulfide reductase [Arcobacter sp.]|nr:TlpA family protein disulfide reductase [Arcobacter sp.]
MKKIQILMIFILAFFINACDSKNEIDDSIIASENKEVANAFESKTFVLEDINGKKFKLKTTLSGIKVEGFENKIILIDVFATWCPPCIKGIPAMNALQKEYKDDLLIISVLFDKDKTKEDMEEFIFKHNISYIVTIGNENFKLAKELGNISKVPEYYLYDKNGDYIKKFQGETSKNTFKSYIENLK